MSAYAFFVCHRTVDLVAASAAQALRSSLGLADDLISLRRDDVFVLEGMPEGQDEAWAAACAGHAAWFNPNTHRHAFFATRQGASKSAELAASWPEAWIERLLSSDRADLAELDESCDLEAWLALPPADGAYAVSLAAWNSEEPLHSLPRGAWPRAEVEVLPLQLWTLALRASDAEAAEKLALEHAVTRSRDRGLLIHPHVERWARVAPVRSLSKG